MLYYSDMKHIAFFAVLLCAAAVAGCETTQTAGHGSQEAKRIAAEQRLRQEQQISESDRNLWNAQRDILTRDGNPALRYY